jgi:biotin carboxylase
VEGREFSVETITRDGSHQVLGITEKLTTGPPGFVELGHQFPARLPTAIAQRIDEAVVALLDLVEHRWGPAHTEVRVTPAVEVVIIESQTRFGGDQIWKMVEVVTGVPLGAATAAGLLGMPEPAKPARAGGAAIRFLGYENAQVHEVAGVEEAREAAGVERVEIRARPGQRLGPLRDSWSRQGYILATGADTEEAARNVDAARGLLRVSLTPL